MFYGFEHRYGSTTIDDYGDPIGKLVIFETRAARDAWLEDGNPYLTKSGARTAMRSRQAAKFQRVCANVEYFEPSR